MVTVEFYQDMLQTTMIGAVYLEAKRYTEHVDLIGKAICKARKLSSVECVIYDENGDPFDQQIVFPRR